MLKCFAGKYENYSLHFSPFLIFNISLIHPWKWCFKCSAYTIKNIFLNLFLKYKIKFCLKIEKNMLEYKFTSPKYSRLPCNFLLSSTTAKEIHLMCHFTVKISDCKNSYNFKLFLKSLHRSAKEKKKEESYAI